jgi:hypothetical protein
MVNSVQKTNQRKQAAGTMRVLTWTIFKLVNGRVTGTWNA